MKAFSNSVLLTFSAAALALTAASTAHGDGIWVRVDRPVHEAPAFDGLVGYGSFFWGQVSADELTALEAAGDSVRVIPRPFELNLGGLTFDPATEFPVLESSGRDHDRSSHDFRLIQFDGPIRDEWLDAVRGLGIETVQYIHPYAYVVWADQAQLEAAGAARGVRWTGEFAAEFRVIPEQRDFGAPDEATMMAISRHADEQVVRQRIEAAGGEVLRITPYTSHLKLVELIAPGDRYMDLGRIPAVYTVQRAPRVAPRGEMRNQAIVGDHATNQDVVPGYANWLDGTGYDGGGVIVSVIDGGIRETHQDLVGNISPCVSQGSPTSCTSSNDTHGTHVAGAIAGTGASGSTDAGGFLQGQGVAPGASVVQQRYNSPGLSYGFGSTCSQEPYCLSPSGSLILFREAAMSGAVLANNSWGATGVGIGYDLPSQQIDAMVRDADPDNPGHHPLLPVWAILNGGGDGSGCNGSSLSSPDEAKNIFGIGSTELRPGSYPGGVVIPNPSDLFGISANSAHGMACDGRQVPQMVAPGCGTRSSAGGGNAAYSTLCGTSMAAPTVAGAAAVFIEYYRDRFSSNPSPALIKAAFTAAAIDLKGHTNADGGVMGHRPDRFQGFGRVDLDAVVNPSADVVYFDQEEVFTATGQNWSVSLAADDPDAPVRIMLAWTDAQGHGLAGTTPAWVNDLDLVVDAFAGTYLGNRIGLDGFSHSGGDPDGINNMEAIYLRPDQHEGAGFELTVVAANIAGDALNPHDPDGPSQDFALVCYNCALQGKAGFSITLDPDAADACIPQFGTEQVLVDIDMTAAAGYTGTVALTASGEPAGVGSVLDPDAVTPPGQSSWTLTVDNTAATGQTPIVLTGDDGDDSQSVDFLLNLDTPLAAPELLVPADGAFGVGVPPQFSWEALPDAQEYQIQVATDTIFIANLVMDETVTEPQMTATVQLEPGAQYFWRVRGDRNCGGAWSQIYGFTTLYNTGELVVSPGTVAFGDVDVDAVSMLAVTVEHSGGAGVDPLELTVIDSEGDPAFAVIGGDCAPGDTLAPAESCVVEVGFSPHAAGAFAGTVRIAAIDGQEVAVTLVGAGIEHGPVEPVDALFRDRFEESEPELAIVTDALPDLHVLERYEIALAAEGGMPPYTWAVGGLPSGLFLDAVSGMITNNPVRPAISGAGDYNVTFEVTDAKGSTGVTTLPLSVVGIARISVGDEHACAVSTAGRGYCWGHNDQGQLGNGVIGEFGEPNPLPTPVVDPDDPTRPMTGLVDIAASRYHSCAATEDSNAYCWGWNAAGRLGNGSEDDSPVAVAVADPDNPGQPLAGVTGVSVGQIHSCASTTDDRVYCWGDNFYGQIGTTTSGHHLLPTPVVDPENTGQPLSGLVQVAAGNFHTCAVTAGHAAYCWGWNTAGQLGNNTSLPGQFPTPLPQRVVDPADPEQPFIGFAHISGGNVHTCALSVDATAYCWGLGNHGQLGDGNAPNNSVVPSPVVDPDDPDQPLFGVSGVDAGGLHSCGVGAGGRAYCWGSNDRGQLGDGTGEGRPIPAPVVWPDDALPGFDHVNARGAYACAVTGHGIPYCWGDNRHGQLGDGNLVPRAIPVPVRAGEMNQ